MKLLGIDSGYNLTEIKLSECPSIVSKYNLAHLARENSPLIRIDSIVYYDEDNDVCEGDLVYDNNNLIGTVFYSEGWRVLHKTPGPYKLISELGHIKVDSSERRNLSSFKEINMIEGRKPIRLCIGKDEFNFDSLVMPIGNEIIVKGRRHRIINDEIFISTGIYNDNKRALGFSTYYNGGIICVDTNHDLAIKGFDGKFIKLNLEENKQ